MENYLLAILPKDLVNIIIYDYGKDTTNYDKVIREFWSITVSREEYYTPRSRSWSILDDIKYIKKCYREKIQKDNLQKIHRAKCRRITHRHNKEKKLALLDINNIKL